MSEENAPLSKAAESSKKSSESHNFPIVGIGASAGGIKALKEFFARMPSNSGMVFVVILHLSQQHESNLDQILQSQTKMPVTQVVEDVKVEPNHVYVIPPAKHLQMIDGVISLTTPQRIKGRRVSVDLFFRTLADAYNDNAVCVVLSGTGSDGTLGLKRVKENGGIAIVQDPTDAEYDGMPRNAIASGYVDLILPVEEIPARLVSLRRVGSQFEQPLSEEENLPQEIIKNALREILAIVKVRTGHDFSSYKQPTLLRRVERRMRVRILSDISQYLAFLRENMDEVPLLLRDFLISVTNFFRDKEAFEALEREVVPLLFHDKTASDTIRVWVCGCATGEEAYSLAMLISEHADRLSTPPQIQIFATDISEEVIAVARDAVYEETIVVDVSPERLRRFFVKENDSYRIKKELREKVLFAPHNILRDPPFSKQDLVTCRNLLIYMNRDAQDKILEVFHFALRPEGFLFLGSSETADSQSTLFSVIDKKQRIYRCRPSASVQHSLPIQPPVNIPRLGILEHQSGKQKPKTFSGELHQRIVERLAPPSILVNEDYDILHLSEHAGRFLRIVGGEPTMSLLKVVLSSLRLELRAALIAARQENRLVESGSIEVTLDGEEMLVNIAVHPIDEPEAGDGFLLVIFKEYQKPYDGSARTEKNAESSDTTMAVITDRLEGDLQRTKDRLRMTIEQYETSTEELKASNEELLSMNEELRSTAEELETSKEELQSVNEELTTVNHEHKEKIEEVSRANSDLQNLMSATRIATIFLDRALRIKRYTPSVAELFNIIPSDEGRPFEHLTHKLDYHNLAEDAETVLRVLLPSAREIRSLNNRYYIVRVLPYLTVEDKIDGVVLTFTDITELKHATNSLIERDATIKMAQRAARAGVWNINIATGEAWWSEECNDLYGLASIIERMTFETWLTKFHTEDRERVKEAIQQAIKENKDFSFEFRVNHPAKGRRWLWEVGKADLDEDGNPLQMTGITLDITERKRSEEALRGSEAKFRNLLEKLPAAAYTCNAEGLITYFNQRAVKLWGRAPKLNDPADKFCGSFKLFSAEGKPIPHNLCWMALAIDEQKAYDGYEIMIEREDGSRLTALAHANPIHDESGALIGAVNVLVDINERRQMEHALRQSEERYRLLIESAKDYAIFTLTTGGIIDSWNAGAERVFGYTEEEILGQNTEILFTPEDRASGVPQREIEEAAQKGRASDERYHIRKDGTKFYASGVMTPLHDTQLQGFAKIARDLTERKQMEEALHEADRRKDEFLATLSHELRNPLSAISSALEVMNRGGGREEAARLVIERQLEQVVRLVDDLLDVSRITQDKINLQITRVELSAVIESALETNHPLLADKQHELTTTLFKEPLYLEADPIRLNQIFLNLLTNAIRYTESGGKIRLTSEREGDQVIVRVRDTGIGISPELMPHIFEMFTQGARAGYRGQGGLGIGLCLAKKLTEMHGGTLGAHSEGLGHGSEFVVRLPLAVKQRPAHSGILRADPAPKSDPASKRILVVDDNTDSAEMLEVALTLEGHEVRIAYNGETAIKTALEFQPELMFLDIGLPDINGYEVAKHLRDQLPQTLFIALSGWGQETDRRRSIDAGFDRHLVKPLDFDLLPELLAASRN